MVKESLGFLFVLAVMAAIGFGPSLWALPAGERRLAHAAAIAPTVGYTLIGLVGFPLVVYVGPVRMWGWPITAVLLLVSLVATALYWLRHGRAVSRSAWLWTDWPLLGTIAVVFLILCGPLLLLGINYTVYRSNASDLYVPVSLSSSSGLTACTVSVP